MFRGRKDAAGLDATAAPKAMAETVGRSIGSISRYIGRNFELSMSSRADGWLDGATDGRVAGAGRLDPVAVAIQGQQQFDRGAADAHAVGQRRPQVAHALSIVTELLAPQLWDRYNNDRWLITKAGISTRDTAKLVIGPKHMLAKTVIILVLAFAAFIVVLLGVGALEAI